MHVTQQDTGNNRLFSPASSFSAAFNPMQTWLYWIYHISVMLASSLFLCADKGYWRREKSKTEDCLSLHVVRWRLLAFTPLQILRYNLCAATSYVTSLLNTSLHCIYNMHITLALTHACKHCMGLTCIYLPCGSPLGFSIYSQSLDVSLKMLNVSILHNYLCKKLLHTTRSRSPHNAPHSPSCLTSLVYAFHRFQTSWS